MLVGRTEILGRVEVEQRRFWKEPKVFPPSVSGRENEGKDVCGDYPQREDVHRGE